MAVQRDWRGPEVLERILANVRAAVQRSAIIVQREIKLQLSLSSSPSAPGTPPGVRTGTLRRGIQVDLTGIGASNPSALVLVAARYGRIHEFGGRIVPTKAKALAVPIGAEGRRTSRGAGGSIRSLNLTLTPRKGKPALLRDQSGKPLFVLLSSVTLPARPFVRPAVSAVRERILDQFSPTRLLGPGFGK